MNTLTNASPFNAGNSLNSDTRSIDSLRAAAARDPKSSIKEAAKQFESLFMNEVMKSMRASTLSSGMLDNPATQMGTEMLDTQFAGKLTGLPGGLSEAITRQLQRQMGVTPEVAGTPPRAVQPLPSLASKNIAPHVQSFIQKHDAAAKAASAETGIPASFMLAQAAHESGWGRREITAKDGTPSHNVFGIKATGSWTGKVAEVTTTEYIDGKAQKVTAKFRAYAKLMTGNARYHEVVAQAQKGGAVGAEGFARGLQKAGYATDPDYASKLAKVINTTVRVQRALA